MTGTMQIKLQWGEAKHPGFLSYPYWSIEQDSSPNFKKKGYGKSRATLSRPAWMQVILQYVSYERLIDKVMNRRPDFDKWVGELINTLQSIQLDNYNEEIIKAVRKDMQSVQKWGTNYHIPIYCKLINDNGNKQDIL